MTDVKPLTTENVGQIAERYEAARVMPHYITAAKRVHIGKSDWMEDWWVGWGKDDSCQIEGTPNHWRWLAMLILGLGEPNEAPYSEDKPTPEIVPQLLATIKADRETIRELTEQRDAFQAQAEYERQARIDAANFPRNRHGYIACMRCGLDCGMDAIIPDDAWALIAPDESGGGMFCLWCMDELLAEKGMRNIPVALYFPGKALLSLLYDDVADAIRTLAEAVCAAVEGE